MQPVHLKEVDSREFLFTLLASRAEISPPLINWQRIPPRSIVVMEKPTYKTEWISHKPVVTQLTRGGEVTKDIPERYLITLEKYPFTLHDIHGSWQPYCEQLLSRVKELHSLGIIHHDLHEDNVVVNPNTGDVRLIDFGLSKWIDEVEEDDLVGVYEIDLASTQELIEYEEGYVNTLCQSQD